MKDINVLEFIAANAKLHSNMVYNFDRKSFNLQPYGDTTPGIYFILDENDILKIGKADGRLGLKGRVSTYRARLVTRYKVGDPTVLLWEKIMTGKLDGKILKMYVLPLEPTYANFKGIEVEMLMARSLEYKLSKLASLEGHSMALSGQS